MAVRREDRIMAARNRQALSLSSGAQLYADQSDRNVLHNNTE